MNNTSYSAEVLSREIVDRLPADLRGSLKSTNNRLALPLSDSPKVRECLGANLTKDLEAFERRNFL